MPGVAGQVYIDILSRDKLNLDNVGKGAGKAGARAGREYGKEWYKSWTGSLNGMSQSFYRAFNAAFNGNGSPFTVVINDMYSNGLTAGKLFADGFEKVFKANMSKSISSLNPNMKNLARNNSYKVVGQGVDSQGNTFNRYKRSGAPGSKFSGDPYYLLNPQAQEAFKKNKANFLDTYGTGGPMYARIAGFGPSWMGMFSPSRAYRARTFTRQAYESGLYNNKHNFNLLDAIKHNVSKATGAKGREFQYVATGPARFLGESFNRRLATPDTLSYLLASRNYNKDKWTGKLGAGLASTAIYADAGIRTAIPVMVKGFEGSALTALSSNIAGMGLAGKTAVNGVKAYTEPQAVLYRMKARSSGEDIDAVGRAARNVAGELSNITVAQMTKTAENMQRAGWKANDIITALPAVGLGANALDKSPEQLVEDLVSVANIFHIDPSEWSDMMNVLAKAANQSPMKFDDIVAYLRQAGTNAYNGGSTLNEALADMLVLTKYTGIQWGANLGTLGRSMQRGIITNSQFLADMGVAMFDEKGEQRHGTDLNIAIAEAIRRNNPNLSEAEANLAAQKIYGSYGARGAGAGHAKIEDYDDFYNQITNSDDLLTRLANASRQGLSGTWGLAKSKIDTMNNQIGEILAPSIQRFLDFVPPAIDVLKDRLAPVMQRLGDALDGVTEESIRKTIDEFINTMVQMEENGVQLIKEILNTVSQYLPGVMQSIREIATGLSNFFHNWVEPGAEAVKSTYNFGTEKFMEYNSYWNSLMNRVAAVNGDARGMSDDEKSLADFATKNIDSVEGTDERGFLGKSNDFLASATGILPKAWKNGGLIGQIKGLSSGNDPNALNQKNFLRDLSSSDPYLQAGAARYFWDDDFVTPSVLLKQYNISHDELKRRVKMGLTVAEALYGLFPETQESDVLLKEVERSSEAVGQREEEDLPPGYDPFFSPKSLFGGKGGAAGPVNENVKKKPVPARGAKNDPGEALPLYPGYTFGNPFNEKNGYVADMSIKQTVERMMPRRDEKGKFMFDERGNPIMEMQTLVETLGRTNELLFDTNDEVEKLTGIPQGTIAANPYHSREDAIAYIKDKLGQDGRLWTEHRLVEQGSIVSDLINNVLDRDYANFDGFSLDTLEEILQKIYDAVSNISESAMMSWQDELTGKTYSMTVEDYQNGGYLDVNKDREAYEKEKKKKKTLSPEEQAERDRERERKAELRAQREFERSKAENARKFEKWKIESQRKWEESMMKAQMVNDEAVSGSLGGLDKVFGFDNTYSTEKDWVKAIVNPDLTGQTVKEILGNLNTFGTVNPFEVAQQKTMLNFQELAQRDMEKAMQEERATEMWYEYLQAVTAGGTVSKFEISDSALSFQFQNVPNIEVKDSDLHIEAQKVVASIDEEIKEHVKRIANYCEEQSLPIVV